jgi:hypothetical protein
MWLLIFDASGNFPWCCRTIELHQCCYRSQYRHIEGSPDPANCPDRHGSSKGLWKQLPHFDRIVHAAALRGEASLPSAEALTPSTAFEYPQVLSRNSVGHLDHPEADLEQSPLA